MSLSTQNGHKSLWVSLGASLEGPRTPFLTFCLCGLFGILPDIDHIIQIGDIPREASSRFIHFPVLIITSTIILWMVAYYIRLLWESFLSRRV